MKNYSDYEILVEEITARNLLKELEYLQSQEDKTKEKLRELDLNKILDEKLRLQIKIYKE